MLDSRARPSGISKGFSLSSRNVSRDAAEPTAAATIDRLKNEKASDREFFEVEREAYVSAISALEADAKAQTIALETALAELEELKIRNRRERETELEDQRRLLEATNRDNESALRDQMDEIVRKNEERRLHEKARLTAEIRAKNLDAEKTANAKRDASARERGEEIQKLQSRLATHEKRDLLLDAKTKRLEEENAKLKSDLFAASETRSALERTIAELESAAETHVVSAAEIEADRVKTVLASQTNDNAVLRTQLVAAEAKMAKAIEAREEALELRAKDAEEAKQSLERLRAELEESDARRAALVDEATKNASKRAAFECERASSKSVVDQLRAEIVALERSVKLADERTAMQRKFFLKKVSDVEFEPTR